MPAHRVRMRDVAAAAGVDVSVVSRVLSEDRSLSVRPATRRRVLEAVQQLGYRPNTAARTLKTARAMAVGMVVPDLANVIYAAIARGAEERASAAGYVLLIVGGSAETRRTILQDRVDGLLYAIATSDSVPDISAPGAPPGLLINRREPGAGASVVVDDEAGMALGTRYLLSLGHRKVAHIAGPQGVDTGRRRRAGYLRGMAEQGLPVPGDWVAEAPYDELGGWTAATRLLRASDRPTAIVAANARAAMGAMAAVRQANLRVPQDVSILGLHDIPQAPYLEPPLTTIRMPLAELGSRAVDMLLDMIDGGTATDVVLSNPPELIVRGSCAPPSATA